jgi:hypothetical protein
MFETLTLKEQLIAALIDEIINVTTAIYFLTEYKNLILINVCKN